MAYIDTSSLQSFMSRTHSYIIIVDFTSESDLSKYGSRQILYVKIRNQLVHWSRSEYIQ